MTEKPMSAKDFRAKYGDRFPADQRAKKPSNADSGPDPTESMKGVKCHVCGKCRGVLKWIEGRTFVHPDCEPTNQRGTT